MAQDSEKTTCDVCGRTWASEADDPEGWISLEVTRAVADGDAWWVNGDFCSQEHAADWLRRPLPRPEPLGPYVMTWRERAVGFAFAFGVGLASSSRGSGHMSEGTRRYSKPVPPP